MENSKILWTDNTFNPWWGCTKVSDACDNCYAAAWDQRFHGGANWGARASRQRTGKAKWREPVKWNRAAEASGEITYVFAASLADIFDNKVPPQWRTDFWDLVNATPRLVWLILTKRPQNMAAMLPGTWGHGWPNVWLGVTAEDQTEADRRLPILTATPAARRFVSYEPALGPVDWEQQLDGIDWLLAGCETLGSKRPGRPTEIAWIRHARDACAATGAVFFLKQMAVGNKVVEGPELDGRQHIEWPDASKLKD